MKRKSIIVLALLAAFSTGCETAGFKKPTARLTGLKFEDVKLDSTTLLFDVEVDNPYPFALPLMNLDYGLTSNGNKFLAGDADIQSTVPAKRSRES